MAATARRTRCFGVIGGGRYQDIADGSNVREDSAYNSRQRTIYQSRPGRSNQEVAMSYACRVKLTVAAVAAVIALSQTVYSQHNAYQTIDNYLRLPEGRKLGSTPGITVDRDGTSVWVFERCGAQNCVGSNVAPILKFDASGKLVKSFGAGMFVRPHGIHVDREGNVWVTDGEGPDGKDPNKNGKGHQVFKFSPDGQVLMTLGKAGITGDGPDTFNQPSAVVIAPNGDIFVGDGHGGNSNVRIVKFSKDGKFIKAWGKKGTAAGEFDTPHALAMDSRGRLFVGDRGNNRIQIFDQDGKFLEEWKQFGRPSGVFIDKNDTLYLADHQSDAKTNPGFRKGIAIGSAKDGKVADFILDPDSEGSQEGVAADAKGIVYGSLTGGMAVKRYVKAAAGTTASSHSLNGSTNYEVDLSWPKPLPNRWVLGGLGGVCVDRQDHVFILNRQDVLDVDLNAGRMAPQIIELDPAGNVVNSWGDAKLLETRLHSCHADKDNNIWVASAPSGMVQKYSHDGSKLLLQIGKKGVFDSSDGTVKGKPLNSNAAQFFMPSSIFVDRQNGDMYVSDGEGTGGNRRIAVMDRDGKFLRQWQPEGMETVHCLSVANDGLVYVCNRTGSKIQVYDKMGSLKRTIDVPWTPVTPPKDGKLTQSGGSAVAIDFSPDQ